jgi:aspartyl aminopeptidase
LLAAENPKSVPVLCVFDSEEVGSCSAQGADSTLLTDVLARICKALGLNKRKMYANSFLLSADNAHAIHPNHPEYADANNAPVLNGGIVLKFNADLRYTTDGASAAVVRHLCKEAGITAQSYYNRADLKGGSTLGHISAGHLSVSAADIGLAQLAMHSGYETAGSRDAADMVALLKAYFAGYTSEIVRI